ncbi:MAG: NAD(P)H-binding protein [Gemmatimonadales bacterium]
MLIAVTGATGFVGRHIVDVLVERGHRVRALVRDRRRLPPRAAGTVEAVAGELPDPGSLRALVAGADAVIHLVGIIVERGPATFTAVHVDGTRAVVAAARAAGCRRFIHMSAVGARDEPGATPYHRTKRRGEAAVEAGGVPYVILRPSFISGPGNLPITTLARLHRRLPLVPVFGDGRFPTQPVWVGDVALAFTRAAEGTGAGTLELGGAAPLSYEEFVRAIGRASGHPRPLIHIPLPLVRAVTRAFDLLGPAAPLTGHQLQMLVEGSSTPGNALERVFGIRPVGFEEGLRRYLSGERGQGNGER